MHLCFQMLIYTIFTQSGLTCYTIKLNYILYHFSIDHPCIIPTVSTCLLLVALLSRYILQLSQYFIPSSSRNRLPVFCSISSLESSFPCSSAFPIFFLGSSFFLQMLIRRSFFKCLSV